MEPINALWITASCHKINHSPTTNPSSLLEQATKCWKCWLPPQKPNVAFSIPLYLQLRVESAALLVLPFQSLELPPSLGQPSLCRLNISLLMLKFPLLLAQQFFLPQQLINRIQPSYHIIKCFQTNVQTRQSCTKVQSVYDYITDCHFSLIAKCQEEAGTPHVRTMCLTLASSCCWKPSSSSRSSLFWKSAKLCSIISSSRADRAAFS